MTIDNNNNKKGGKGVADDRISRKSCTFLFPSTFHLPPTQPLRCATAVHWQPLSFKSLFWLVLSRSVLGCGGWIGKCPMCSEPH
jgi:hypothetical protein